MNKRFTFFGDASSSFLDWLSAGIQNQFTSQGYEYVDSSESNIKLVFNYITEENPRPFRRKAQATFVVSVLEGNRASENIFKLIYPFLVRSLSNHLMYIVHNASNKESIIYFLTPEQGCYKIVYNYMDEEAFFQKIYQRLEPLASSQLVIDNEFTEDLNENLWNGDNITESLKKSGKKLNEMNLLPAPFPLEEYLSKKDIKHLNRLYGIGGLSYGNLSARCEQNNFWMSASGIDKGNMKDVGRDFLYINGYNEKNNKIRVKIPPKITPKRASVDAIEHWMIYKEHPSVGAIVHIHAWMEGVKATEINYPCGTIELAQTVAELVNNSSNPSRAVIGLKNHGLTITGTSLEDIFERIDGKILKQVPMG